MPAAHADMLVADLELARRLERAEALANAEFVEARAVAFPDVGSQWIEVAGARVMFDGIDSPCTQTFGLGLFETVADADLGRIERFFHERGAAVHHEVCPLADASFVQLLNERGYEPFEFSNVMFRPILSAVVPGETDTKLRVRLVGPADQDRWAATGAAGWRDVAPGLEDFIRTIAAINPHRPHGHSFLVEHGDEAIAAGALSVFEGVALFAGACTIPQWRKRGAQRALLAHRLQFGAECGCDLAMIVAAPGSASQRNAEREGFRIAYTRIKWRLRGG